MNLFYAKLKRLALNIIKYNERNVNDFINLEDLQNKINLLVELNNDSTFRSRSFIILDILFIDKVNT